MHSLPLAARPGRSMPPVTLVGAQDFVEPEDVEAASGRAAPVPDDPDRVRPDSIDREQLVREAAYYRYVSRGRVDGHALEDWLNAQADVDHLFGCG
jgi:hypothetical protein